MSWTPLTYAFGSKLTSTKMTQNQANFLAVAAGDSGAPNIVDAAHTPVTAGSTYLWAHDGIYTSGSTSSPTYALLIMDGAPIIVPRDGTYQVDFDMSGSGGVTATARIYKNGAGFGTEQTQGNSVDTKSENLTFSEGDYIEIYGKIGSSETCTVANLKLMSVIKRLG